MTLAITAPLLRSWSACWDDMRIKSHLAGRESLTLHEVAADESIPLDDRLWVLGRALWHLSPTRARLCAIESAELVAHLAGDEDDQAQYLGLMNELRQVELELPEEQRDAARAAARDAARAAAQAAARVDAWATAWAAARVAAWAAARVAAWAAARVAELRKAIVRCLEWIEGCEVQP